MFIKSNILRLINKSERTIRDTCLISIPGELPLYHDAQHDKHADIEILQRDSHICLGRTINAACSEHNICRYEIQNDHTTRFRGPHRPSTMALAKVPPRWTLTL
jgi:hypothetical protein